MFAGKNCSDVCNFVRLTDVKTAGSRGNGTEADGGDDDDDTSAVVRNHVLPAGHTGHTCTPSAIINGTVTQHRKGARVRRV